LQHSRTHRTHDLLGPPASAAGVVADVALPLPRVTQLPCSTLLWRWPPQGPACALHAAPLCTSQDLSMGAADVAGRAASDVASPTTSALAATLPATSAADFIGSCKRSCALCNYLALGLHNAQLRPPAGVADVAADVAYHCHVDSSYQPSCSSRHTSQKSLRAAERAAPFTAQGPHLGTLSLRARGC
jgi:hypothetical protein